MCTARERACACVSCVVCVGHVCHVGRSLLPYGEVSFDVSHTCARSIRAGRSRRLLPHMSHHMSHHHTHMSHHHTHAAFAPAALGVCCHICHIICHIIIHICHIIIHTQHSRRPLSAFVATYVTSYVTSSYTYVTSSYTRSIRAGRSRRLVRDLTHGRYTWVSFAI